MTKWLLLFALVVPVSQQSEQPPALLEEVLRIRKDLRLLDPARDLPGGYALDEIKAFGYWPPWVAVDLDHDQRLDVVAAVVTRKTHQKRFGVIAVHASKPGAWRWVVPLGRRSLNGVAIDHPASDTVMPLYCIECDSNDWYRWNGHAYEPGLYAIGEAVSVATYLKKTRLGMFSRASWKSRFISEVEPCTDARVLRRRGTSYQTRWYFIKVDTSGRQGWVPASFLAESECIG